MWRCSELWPPDEGNRCVFQRCSLWRMELAANDKGSIADLTKVLAGSCCPLCRLDVTCFTFFMLSNWKAFTTVRKVTGTKGKSLQNSRNEESVWEARNCGNKRWFPFPCLRELPHHKTNHNLWLLLRLRLVFSHGKFSWSVVISWGMCVWLVWLLLHHFWDKQNLFFTLLDLQLSGGVLDSTRICVGLNRNHFFADYWFNGHCLLLASTCRFCLDTTNWMLVRITDRYVDQLLLDAILCCRLSRTGRPREAGAVPNAENDGAIADRNQDWRQLSNAHRCEIHCEWVTFHTDSIFYRTKHVPRNCSAGLFFPQHLWGLFAVFCCDCEKIFCTNCHLQKLPRQTESTEPNCMGGCFRSLLFIARVLLFNNIPVTNVNNSSTEGPPPHKPQFPSLATLHNHTASLSTLVQ